MNTEPAPTLVIRCAERRAIHEAIRLLLATCAGDALVRIAVDNSLESPGVSVHLENSSRWMCVMRDEHDVQTARWALANGAWCLASLEGPLDQFEDATRALVQGNPHYLPVSFARLIATGEQRQSNSPQLTAATFVSTHTPLTAREREVLRCLAEGLSNAEIADRLSISIHTVRTHLSSMATKIDASNRLKLVAKATQLGYPEAGARAAE
jgi:DNA-binding NarL/FixJ family response regulator